MSEPVSVIIPCHNQARFLPDAIASVLAQDWPVMEVIVVDDGSSDDVGEALHGASSIVRLVRQRQSGAAAARNHGVRLAQANLIAFLDADDLWPTHSLSLRAWALMTRGSDLAFGAVAQQLYGQDDPLQGAIVGRMAGSMLVRRSAFTRVGPINERLASAEMLDWFARADEAGLTAATVPELVLIRRVHGANMMLTNDDGAQHRLAVLRGALQRRRAAAQ